MNRLFRRFSFFFCLIPLAMFFLASCGEQSDQTERAEKTSQSDQAQETRCTELEKLFAMDDWDSLATGPFETDKTEHMTSNHAPAKIMIAGAEDCSISHEDVNPGSYFSLAENFHMYSCDMPVPKSAGNDALRVLKALAAPWKSCVNGWKEFSPPPMTVPETGDTVATLSFKALDKTLLFMTLIGSERSSGISLHKAKPRP